MFPEFGLRSCFVVIVLINVISGFRIPPFRIIFGFSSHISLRDDYETSCEETDILAELAWQIPGVYGSRITGGGFGGFSVSIVKNDAIDTFIDKVGTVYKEKTGHTAEFYVVDIGDGARPLN